MDSLLLIEDSEDVHEIVRSVFPDYLVTVATSLAAARKVLEQKHALAIIDIELPDGNGLALYSELRSRPGLELPPCIFLTAHDDLQNKLMAFSLGSEDFVAKPFEPLELRARVTAKIRRAEATPPKVMSFGELRIDPSAQRVWIQEGSGSRNVDLTVKEFRLLVALAQRFDHVLSRDRLLDEVWRGSAYVLDRTVDTHLSRLRRKLGLTGLVIESVAGEGYRLTQAKAPAPKGSLLSKSSDTAPRAH